MPIPSLSEVLNSVTDEVFSLRNWSKHRDDARYETPYPFHDAYGDFDGKRFTRQHVFDHFAESLGKGVISTIKWGYPGGTLQGNWFALSTAMRSNAYAETISELRKNPLPTAADLVRKLNSLVKGVSTSTTTKIAYFAGLKAQAVDDTAPQECLIYDQMVRRVIRQSTEPELAQLGEILRSTDRDIWPTRQATTYGLYLASVHALARRRGVEPSQIELCLFRAGRLLPRLEASPGHQHRQADEGNAT